MQKRFIILITYILCVVGCAHSWANEEKTDFINDCVTMNGTETMCVCILSCLEKEYITYNKMLSYIENKKLTKECKACLEQCNSLID